MIAVTGANGQLGQMVIKHLLEWEKPQNIVALVRRPEKATALKDLGVNIRRGDYNDYDSLLAGLESVQTLLLISSSEVGKRVSQHKAVIEAASDSGVHYLVYTSVLKADRSPMKLAEEHKLTEQYLQAADIPSVVIRNGWYSENYTDGIEGILASGKVVGVARKGKIQSAARNDYAEAAALILRNVSEHLGNVYELAGDAGFTLAEFADLIAAQSGRDIAYQPMTQAAFTGWLSDSGIPNDFAEALADSEVCADNGWLEESSCTLSRILGRPTTPLAASIREQM